MMCTCITHSVYMYTYMYILNMLDDTCTLIPQHTCIHVHTHVHVHVHTHTLNVHVHVNLLRLLKAV